MEIFAPLASFVEEVVAPIPSPAVMIVTGTLAQLQGRGLSGLIILVALAAVGKLLGALVIYFIVDKAEDLLMGKFAKFFGVSHKEIEAFGQKLGGGPRDYFFLTLLRALPIVPSSIVSIGCGVLKVRMKLFLFSTSVGTLIRDSIYIYFGFAGADLFKSFIDQTATIESLVQVLAVAGIGLFLVWAWWRRRKQS